MITNILFGGVGFVAGAFCPSVLRKIKTWYVKEVATIQADIKAEVKKIEAKL